MKTRFIKEMVYATIFFLIFLPSIASAQPLVQGSAEEEGGELTISDITGELSLTPQQKEQLKEQRYQAELKKIDTRNKIRLKELQLRHELEKKETNREVINKIVEELKELQGTMLGQRVDSILEMKQILTPEQFEKLQSLGERRRQKTLKGLGDKFPHRKKQ